MHWYWKNGKKLAEFDHCLTVCFRLTEKTSCLDWFPSWSTRTNQPTHNHTPRNMMLYDAVLSSRGLSAIILNIQSLRINLFLPVVKMLKWCFDLGILERKKITWNKYKNIVKWITSKHLGHLKKGKDFNLGVIVVVDGVQVPVMAAVPNAGVLLGLLPHLCGAERLVLLGSQHDVRIPTHIW